MIKSACISIPTSICSISGYNQQAGRDLFRLDHVVVCSRRVTLTIFNEKSRLSSEFGQPLPAGHGLGNLDIKNPPDLR
jgi:hypothetical protein